MLFDLGIILLASLMLIDVHKHPTTEHEREVVPGENASNSRHPIVPPIQGDHVRLSLEDDGSDNPVQEYSDQW
jgi:hypothetical protein